MTEKEIISLSKQLFLAFHKMKLGSVPLQFNYNFLDENSLVYRRCCDVFYMDKWKVLSHFTENITEICNAKDIVVLSPDAELELEEVDPGKVYVICGLVDISVRKNESWCYAQRSGFEVRKLPVKKVLSLYNNCILNVNTVVEALIGWLETRSWEHALSVTIPKRKQQVMGRRGLRRQRLKEMQEGEKPQQVWCCGKARNHTAVGVDDEILSAIQTLTEQLEAL